MQTESETLAAQDARPLAGRCFLAGGIFRDSDGGFRHCHEGVPNRHQLCDWAGSGMHSRGGIQHGRRTA